MLRILFQDGKDGSAGVNRADERGITLQTLIVTAVLVLMAVVAGVVIIALTGSSSDDLEESGSDLEGRCDFVEIYDPEVAALNKDGKITSSNGVEVRSSRIGCFPVCVWRDSNSNAILDIGEVEFHRNRFDGAIRQAAPESGTAHSYFLYSGIPDEIATYDRERVQGEWVAVPYLLADDVDPEIHRVAVAPEGNDCLTYNVKGDPLLG